MSGNDERVIGILRMAAQEQLREQLKQSATSVRTTALPTDTQERKDLPIMTGVLDYFPAAIAYVAKISKIGNEKHNPGQPLHWSQAKSADHADCVIRHLMDRGEFDEQGIRHSGYAAWRALANLQMELQAAGAPKARGAK